MKTLMLLLEYFEILFLYHNRECSFFVLHHILDAPESGLGEGIEKYSVSIPCIEILGDKYQALNQFVSKLMKS